VRGGRREMLGMIEEEDVDGSEDEMMEE